MVVSHLVRLDVGHEVGGGAGAHGHLALDLVEEVLLTPQEVGVRKFYLLLVTLNTGRFSDSSFASHYVANFFSLQQSLSASTYKLTKRAAKLPRLNCLIDNKFSGG